MRVIFYEVFFEYATNGSTLAFATKKAALAERRTMTFPNGRTVKVTTLDLPPRELCARIAEGTGYAESMEEIAPAQPEQAQEADQ